MSFCKKISLKNGRTHWSSSAQKRHLRLIRYYRAVSYGMKSTNSSTKNDPKEIQRFYRFMFFKISTCGVCTSKKLKICGIETRSHHLCSVCGTARDAIHLLKFSKRMDLILLTLQTLAIGVEEFILQSMLTIVVQHTVSKFQGSQTSMKCSVRMLLLETTAILARKHNQE